MQVDKNGNLVSISKAHKRGSQIQDSKTGATSESKEDGQRQFSPELDAKVSQLFTLMDCNGDGKIDRSETLKFFTQAN